jgi:acetolactate synthase-1/3 small subunit
MAATPNSTLVALVQDNPGVLTKVAMLFRRRGFNIASLNVGHSEVPGVSRMTIVIEGRGSHIRQCEKQLYKLVEVLKVSDLTDEPRVDKEVALIRVSARSIERAEVVGIARAFDAEVVDVARDSVIVEITASPYTIDRFLEITSDFGILELTRTGVVSMARGGNGKT